MATTKKKRRRYKTGPKKGQIIPITRRQRAFGTVAKAANAVCHRETNSVAAYKVCMKKEMPAKMKAAGLIGGKKTPKVRKCKGLYKSGPNKGKMKPGYKRGPAGRCPVKKAG